ncbi:MAG TPA: triose-phosphate isomerase [Candidatus Korarchaeota archaeon]|nr:triose-phosphate isomerase [Candidatus Korarchaeota archaeon]
MNEKFPMILVNLKVYEQSIGERALDIGKAAESVWKDSGIPVGIAPNVLDAVTLAESLEIPIFLQHVDSTPFGAFTGHITPLQLKRYGIAGSLLNHSERRLKLSEIFWINQKLMEEGLISIICATTPRESLSVALLQPTSVAIEPPELIGTGIPVSKAKPEVITETLKLVRSFAPDVKILCGAGISTGDDVKKAIELGTDGVLLASAVAKHPNPKKKLKELVNGALKASKR